MTRTRIRAIDVIGAVALTIAAIAAAAGLAHALARPVREARGAVQKYIAAAREAGCPADQVKNFLRAGIVLQPRQLAASAAARLCDRPCDHDAEAPCHAGCAPTKIGYGGARGGGKSHWVIAQVVADDMTRYPGLKVLYLRKVGKAGKEAVEDLRREVLPNIPHEYKRQEGIIGLPNGSRLVIGHFKNESDIDNYLGLQYDAALIEEATQLTSKKIVDISTCIRSAKPGWRPRTYFTTNPGGVGHGWFKRMFIAPMRNRAETATRFIQATVRDNKAVNANYRRELETLVGWQRDAWLDGDWDIAAGQFFTNWVEPLVVGQTPEIGRDWDVWLSLDYGFTHYTVVYLMAKDREGMLYIVDEHARRGWLPGRHCDAIEAMIGRHGLKKHRINEFVAGADVFSQDKEGRTIAQAYANLGWDMSRANVDRINGAGEMLRRFGDQEHGIAPAIVISPRCTGLIECIPSLQHDPHRPEDVLKVDCDEAGQGGDDHYDAARYGIMQAAGGPRVFIGPSPTAGFRGGKS